MKFTGERFIPNSVEDTEINIEHFQRYHSIVDIVSGKKVLDAASGEGYGSAFLSQYAEHVYGVDISKEAIQSASEKYENDNLIFIQGSIAALPIPDKSVDVVVSFETIEHVSEEIQHKFLKEIKRVIKDNGLLIISTPNKKIYSDVFNYNNEFHVKEFYKEEFKDFLKKYFEHFRLYSQYKEITYNITSNEEQTLKKDGTYDENYAKYYIAIASNIEIPKYNLSITNLVNETTYINEKQRILSLQDEVEVKNNHIHNLNKELIEKGSRIIQVQEEIQEKNNHINSLNNEVIGCRENIVKLQNEVEEKNNHIFTLDENVLKRDERIQELQSEVEEKNGHIIALGEEIISKGKYTRALQDEIEEKNDHICTLDENVLKRDERIQELQNEVEEKNSHIIALGEEIISKGKYTRALQDEIEEKNKHISILDKESEIRGQRILQLQDEVDRKNIEISNLLQRITLKKESISDMKYIIEERNDKVIELERELEDNKYGQQQEIYDLNLEIEKLQNIIRKEDDDLKNLIEQLHLAQREVHQYREEIQQMQFETSQTNEELQKIYHSAGWKLLLKLYKVRDNIAPANTKRRVVAKLGKNLVKAPKRYIKAMNMNNIKTVGKWLTVTEPNDAIAQLDCFDAVSAEEERKVYEIIEFEKVKKPKVSIVIPVYNQWDYTYSCLNAIKKNTQDVTYEIIIADDNSTDRTKNIKKYIKNVKVVRNDTNKGFLLNCNNATKQADGDYIVFLNNDTNVQERWLVTLVGLIESDETIGMVGSKLVYGDGRLQEAGGIIWKDASGWNYGRLDDPNKPEYNYVREVDYISGAAIMLSRKLWQEIGGFDERYIPAYYEDTDLAFEVRKRGYKVMYQPQSVVIHFEGISNGTDINTGIKKYQQDNNKKFYEKWKDVLELHCENGQDVFKAVRNGNKKNILVIDHYVPHFDKDAGSRCTFGYTNLFKKLGLNVTFLGDNFFQHEPYTGELQQRGINVLYGNWYAEHYEEWLKENGKYFDYIYLNRPHISVKYIDVLKEYSKAKIIYFGHDLHYVRLKRSYEIEKNEELLEASKYWKEVEFELFNKADVVYVVGEYEQQVLMNELPGKPIRNIPVYIYNHSQKPTTIGFNERSNILFVGGFNHAPNVDGILWFNEEILPHIKKNIPDIKVYIVGSNPPEQVQALGSEDVIITGFVSDEELSNLYKQSRVVVAPLRYGAGVKGKVVEAIYNQVPLVTTPIGAEGLTEVEKYVFVEQDKEAFAEQVIAIYNDKDKWESMSNNSREYIDKYFSINTAKNIVEQDIDQ